MTDLAQTQKAIAIYPSSIKDIRLVDTELPSIQDPDDAIVKIHLAGLCGSDLHIYRGLEPFDNPYVMGHELLGEVMILGSGFGENAAADRPELYRTLKVGDKVISAFSVSCSECEYCKVGFSSRCIHSALLGSPKLPGAQAQYVRIPKAGGSLVKVGGLDIRDESLLLLADILPTGYWAIKTTLRHPHVAHLRNRAVLYLAIIGLGPVGLCNLISCVDIMNQWATEETPLSLSILAVDSNEDRLHNAALTVAKSVGMTSQRVDIKFVTPEDALEHAKEQWGGVHAVCELVGNNGALRLAYDIIRPFGVITSIGVHTAPSLPFTGNELYAKNVSLSFGRCPARSVFSEALAVLLRQRDVFGVGEGQLIDKVVGFGGADGDQNVKNGYDDFDKGVGGK
ncbi:hypothetical protein FRB99_008118, partial [Tulasnella sp. 403]